MGMANYVGVKKLPEKLFEYGIIYTPIRDDTEDGASEYGSSFKPATQRSFERRSEMGRVFEALKPQLNLDNKIWTTNYTKIWSTEKLIEGNLWTSPTFNYTKQSGNKHLPPWSSSDAIAG
jgi:hypothetical protein